MCKAHFLLSLILIGLLSYISAFGQDKPLPDVNELINHFQEASVWAKSVSMHVNTEVIIIYPYKEAGKIKKARRVYEFTYRRDDNKLELIGQSNLLDIKGNKSLYPDRITDFIKIINNECYVNAYRFADVTRFSAIIKKENLSEELAMYLSNSTYSNFLQGSTAIGGGPYRIAELLRINPYLRGIEDVNGVSCYVIESETPYGKIIAWIAPEKGYNALKYVIHKKGNHLLRGKLLKDRNMNSMVIAIDSIDFQKIGDIFVPVAGQYTRTTHWKDGSVKTTCVKVKRSKIELNPDFEALGAFKINLPNGTHVRIEEHPGIRYIWQDGKIVPADDPTFEEIDKTIEELKKEQQ